MFVNKQQEKEFFDLLEGWGQDKAGVKDAFVKIKEMLSRHPGTVFHFLSRPGISYSLRATIDHSQKDSRPYYAVVDAIDQPEIEKWLSVCFYADTITDPLELGNLIPRGLLGEDGYCFDVVEDEKELLLYLSKRIQQAYENFQSQTG